MNGETVFGMIVMAICGFGCGALIYGIGVSASKRKTPIGFWANSAIDANTITDIPGYNQANAKMWKLYSVPYWLCGIISLLSWMDERMVGLSAVPLFAAGTVGIWWLIHSYNKIVKQYKT